MEESGRERRRERERESGRERERVVERERERERGRERERERERSSKRERDREREGGRKRNRQTVVYSLLAPTTDMKSLCLGLCPRDEPCASYQQRIP